jgi:hypothetical protein
MKHVPVREVAAAVQRLQEKRAHQCRAELPAIARAGGEARPIGKEGRVDMRIHPTSFHYWGQRLGYQCWDDGGFVREYKRDVPEARVRTVSSRTTLSLHSAPAENLRALFGADGRMRRKAG